MADHVAEVLREGEYIEASIIRDRLYDRMRGGTPTIRELSSHLQRNRKVSSLNAPAGVTQIKKYSLKKN